MRIHSQLMGFAQPCIDHYEKTLMLLFLSSLVKLWVFSCDCVTLSDLSTSSHQLHTLFPPQASSSTLMFCKQTRPCEAAICTLLHQNFKAGISTWKHQHNAVDQRARSVVFFKAASLGSTQTRLLFINIPLTLYRSSGMVLPRPKHLEQFA